MKRIFFKSFESLPDDLHLQLFFYLSKVSISTNKLIHQEKRKYFYELKNTTSLKKSEGDLLALINLLFVLDKAIKNVNFLSETNEETQRLVEIIKNDKIKSRKPKTKDKEDFLINRSSEINNMISNGFSSRMIRDKFNGDISHSHICEIVKAYPQIFKQFPKKKS